MAEGAGGTFSLKYQARALCAVPGETHSSQWLVGTNSLREDNEVHYVAYNPDSGTAVSVRSYSHEAEIWDLAPSPSSPDLFISVWGQQGRHGASLWQAGDDGALQLRAGLEGATSTLRHVVWHPMLGSLVVSIEEGAIRRWDVGSAGAQAVGAASLPAAAAGGEQEPQQALWSGALDPNHADVAATTAGTALQLWDLRSMSMTCQVAGAHKMPARDVAFPHPGQPSHRLVSSGDDCKIRFWDTRLVGRSEPLLELSGHSHWVWKVRYSPAHDTLLASCSSDSTVNLWHTPRLAAAAKDGSAVAGAALPAAGAFAATPGSPTAMGAHSTDVEGRVHTYEDHEDSVYCLAWSTLDPWLLASLSYDGRMVINRVPKSVKYKVMI